MRPRHKLIMLLTISGFFLATFFTQSHYPINNFGKVDSSIVLVQATDTEIDNNIPKKLYPCLPKKVEKMRLLGSNTTEQDTYYFVAIHLHPQPRSSNEPPLPTYQETLVKLDNLGCLVIIPKEKLGSVSLTQYVPESVARSLSLQRYRKAILEVGGKEKYQQIWDKGSEEAGDISYLFPEGAWALKQLGINIPPHVQIVTDVEQLSNLNP